MPDVSKPRRSTRIARSALGGLKVVVDALAIATGSRCKVAEAFPAAGVAASQAAEALFSAQAAATATALFQEFKGQRMPDWTELPVGQINDILDYLNGGGPEIKATDERSAETAAPGLASALRWSWFKQGGSTCGSRLDRSSGRQWQSLRCASCTPVRRRRMQTCPLFR
jgi:hypothetical protein